MTEKPQPPEGESTPPPSSSSTPSETPPAAEPPPGATSPPGAPPPGGPQPPIPTIRIWRSRDRRMVAGVCGGLGEATGVDPLFYRVLAVVLTIFGGVGILLYAVGWLLLPEGQGAPSIGERAINRSSGDRTTPLLLAVGLAIVALLAAGAVFNHFPGALLLLLALGGLYLLLRRDTVPGNAGTVAFAGTAPPYAGGAPPYAGAAPPYAGGAPPYAGTGSPSAAPSPAPVTGPASAPPGGEPPTLSWGPTPPPPSRPRERSVLGALTLSVLLIVMGGMALADVTGADIPAAAYPAAALVVTGLGLLAGAWYGRSRGLIAVGIIAGLALPPTAAADEWGPFNEWDARPQLVAPTDVGAIRGHYGFRPGEVELDLTGVNFSERDRRVSVDVPAGDLLVVLPPNVDVTADVDLKIGQAEVFGRSTDGLGISERVTDLGADGKGGGELDLRINQGAGHVEVRRAAS